MRSTALRTASAPAPSVLACRFSTYSPEKSGFTSAAKMQLRHQKGKWHYQTKQTVGASLEFFNKLPKEPAIKFVQFRSRNARSACSRRRDYADISTSVTAGPGFWAQAP